MIVSRNEVPTCIDGSHRPNRRSIAAVAGVERACCRDCGCALVRTAVSRRWYRSGLLGGAVSARPLLAAGLAATA